MSSNSREDSPADSDAHWVALAQQGDRQAFEKLYEAHKARIYALCWRLCGYNRALAEEVTQDAFIRAWQKLGLFRGESRFYTWLHRLAVNVVLSAKRSWLRKVGPEQELNEDLHQKIADKGTHSSELQKDLEHAIADLPDRARSVLVLYDIEGYQHAEIAEMTGMAVGSSKAQLHRARRMLREALEK